VSFDRKIPSQKASCGGYFSDLIWTYQNNKGANHESVLVPGWRYASPKTWPIPNPLVGKRVRQSVLRYEDGGSKCVIGYGKCGAA